ncbi:MAG TPA: hypothetical protein IAC62_01970 [Candidatus Pelethocola excrementipullorum]|nr:hypothetical protein [Candidatus Pelethocola excrementipullorum]
MELRDFNDDALEQEVIARIKELEIEHKNEQNTFRKKDYIVAVLCMLICFLGIVLGYYI